MKHALLASALALAFVGLGLSASIARQDPALGTITVSEAVHLTETYSALPSQANKLTAAANSARITLRSGDLRALDAELAKLEAACKGHAGSLSAWAVEEMQVAILTDPLPPLEPPVVDPPTVPPVEPEPEPPIVVPPVQPPDLPAWPGVGCDESKIDATWDVGPGGGTAGDKAVHAITDHGGEIRNKRVLGGGGFGMCLTTLGSHVKPPMLVENCLLIPAIYGSKQGGTRNYGLPTIYRGVTIQGNYPEEKDFVEDHPLYDSPAAYWMLDGVLARECAGNIQATYRPSEGSDFCREVVAKVYFENCHRRLKNGQFSSMAGPLLALYNLAPDCVAVIEQHVDQRKWSQFGPCLTVVPAYSAGETQNPSLAWWKPGDYTHGSVDWTLDFVGKRPAASELGKFNGAKSIRARGTAKLTDSSAPLRILIDPPFHLGAHAEQVDIDIVVLGPDGAPVACPIERGGVVVRFTTQGRYIDLGPDGVWGN